MVNTKPSRDFSARGGAPWFVRINHASCSACWRCVGRVISCQVAGIAFLRSGVPQNDFDASV